MWNDHVPNTGPHRFEPFNPRHKPVNAQIVNTKRWRWRVLFFDEESGATLGYTMWEHHEPWIITVAGASRYGMFVPLVKGVNGDAGVGSVWRGNSLSSVERRGAERVRAGNGNGNGDKRNGAGRPAEPLLCDGAQREWQREPAVNGAQLHAGGDQPTAERASSANGLNGTAHKRQPARLRLGD